MIRRSVLFTCATAALLSMQWAKGESRSDKSQYHLFNPTPRELMRELTPDRPDVTESPHTVDAGHGQIELSFVDVVRDGDARAVSILPLNLKLGLLNNLDVQFVLEPFTEARDGEGARDSGIGDTQLRLKLNLWGNDGGDTALAIMPFVKFPTAADDLGNDHVEGGLIIPFATSLGEELDLGLMAEFDAVYDESRDSYDMEFVHTIAIGRELLTRIGAYVEYIGIAGTAPDAQYQMSLGTGVTYALSSDWLLDAGVIIGLAGGAADMNPFIGMTVRF